MKKILLQVTIASALAAVAQVSQAGLIPYPNSGSYNSAAYSFTASTTGDVVAYFAGSTAGYDNDLGLSINGAAPTLFGLNDHASTIGDSFNFGHVNAGDSLVFVLRINSLGGQFVYSDPAQNVGYDQWGVTGHNHIYSAPYTTGDVSDFGSLPSGTYIAFEDLSFPYSDYNYHDENFVFTGVAMTPVPEPSTIIAGALLAIPFGFKGLRSLRNRK